MVAPWAAVLISHHHNSEEIIVALLNSARKETNCPSSVLFLYCAISGPTRELSKQTEVTLAAVTVVAIVGIKDPLFVIGHGIGGINFPDIMARLAKMQDRWSKR